MIHLRNRHPKRALAIPFGGSWRRLLPAGATAMLPEAALWHPITQQLMARQLIGIVDGSGCDADERQARAARLDLAMLAARVEQAEIDRLLQGERMICREPRRRRPPPPKRPRKRRVDEWPPAQVALIERRLAAGVSRARIAAELGTTRTVISALIYRHRAKAGRGGPAEAAGAGAGVRG